MLSVTKRVQIGRVLLTESSPGEAGVLVGGGGGGTWRWRGGGGKNNLGLTEKEGNPLKVMI